MVALNENKQTLKAVLKVSAKLASKIKEEINDTEV